MPPDDTVNHPSHYTQGEIEVIDFIEDQALGYHAGNIIKYIARYRHKGTPLEDLKKAAWYLSRLITQYEAVEKGVFKGGGPPICDLERGETPRR